MPGAGAATGVKLTHKTAVVKDGEVYHVNHVPKDMPTAAIDVTMQGHLSKYWSSA